jgi:dihydroorotase
MEICLRGGRVLDPSRGMDAEADVVIVDGAIARVGKGAADAAGAGARVVDARGSWVVPGLIDLHTHLREPGQEYKEDIATGAAAAAAGGYTAVCAMPNTVPPNDNRSVSELIVRRAAEVGLVRVYPVGAISKGLAGESLAEMGELRDAGCVAVSDDGHPVMNAELMRRAMEYARTFGLTIVQHCEDLTLSAGGAMNEGPVSTRAGIRAQPTAAESTMVARDIELCALTGARYHVAHISSAESVRLVREAKRRGLPVTCEVTPHHLTLTDEACASYDTHAKCNPPLRSAGDVEAMRIALVEGVIDAVATDHAPHSPVEKDVEFEQAAFGVIGLETAVPLVMELVRTAGLSPLDFVRRMSTGPAAVFRLRGGSLAEGQPADVTVIDPKADWMCKPAGLRSRSRNTPFAGRALKGRSTLTIVGGRIVYSGEVPS